MAKSTTRTRRPQQHSQHSQHAQHLQHEPDVQDQSQQTTPAGVATAVEAAPPPSPPPQQPAAAHVGGGSGGDDVANLDAETNAKYEQVKGGKLYIKDLQQMDVHQLHEIAKQEGIPDYIGLKKQDLIFQILRSRIRQNGLMYGEGVLEILPDGFGFLRSPGIQLPALPGRHLHQPVADPPFRPAQRARRAGPDPPAQGIASATSRCCASRRSTAKTPSASPTTSNFEDLTPLHPNRRLDPRDRSQRTEHAHRRPGHADRHGPAHADRRAAAHRQDGSAAEDRQRDHRATIPMSMLIILLIDERPEEVTDMERNTKAEVVSLDLRRARQPPRAGRRDGHRKGQAHTSSSARTW